jgi:quercetin dioxygenase-like cupin family protein
MALIHAKSGELVDVRPFGATLPRESTRTVVKTATLEIIRLVMQSGKDFRGHKVPGEITVQCLEGRCTFAAAGVTRDLEPDYLIYLTGGEEHSLQATEDCSLLLTILLSGPI